MINPGTDDGTKTTVIVKEYLQAYDLVYLHSLLEEE